MSKTINGIDDVLALVELLGKSPKVAELSMRYPNPDEAPEANAIAHALRDIKESCSKIFDQLVPQLQSENVTGQEITEVLLEIGEEFRHIIYHIRDPKFFEYLIEGR